MDTYTESLIKTYNEQVKNIFVPQNTMYKDFFEPKLTKALGTLPNIQQLYTDGGLFVDACLERPVMNLTLNPMRALGNRLPVRMSNLQTSTYAFLTGITEPTGALADGPCEDGQVVGNLQAAYGNWSKGRMSFSAQTGEMDSIVERLCRGVHDDLYLIGEIRGQSGPVPGDILNRRDVIATGAVRRQVQLIGRALQREFLRQFWDGDPANGALNTANGGAIQMLGLNSLIANDYGSKAFITGSNKTKLNSVIYDFEETCIGAGRTSDNAGLYYVMEDMEDTLYNRAALMGYAMVETAIVMHPVQWSQVVRYLPCEIQSGRCGLPSAGNGTNVTVVTNDTGMVALQQQMQRDMVITLNGRTYPVILDDTLPLVEDAGPPVTYTGDIYFVPLSVDRTPVLWIESINYTVLSGLLAPLPGGFDNLGATDGGMKLLTVRQNGSCFNINATMKLSLILQSPHLAGRIQDVVACTSLLKDRATGYGS